MASALARRLNLLEGRLGAGSDLTIGRICPDCGAATAFTDPGPCDAHHPPREAAVRLLVAFVSAPTVCPA